MIRDVQVADAATVRDAPTLSVVICAYTTRRWHDLCRAVDSVLAEGDAVTQLIVVLDHCDELHRLVLERYGADARVTAVPNAQTRGLSGARNSGVAVAIGHVVAFVDDDAAVHPGWAASLLVHYRDPEVAAVGGHAAPVWPQRRPSWLPREFDWVVGCSYVGQPTRVATVRNPIGCNMSVRRSALDQVGGFRSDLGRVGTLPVGGEETEFFIRLHAGLPTQRVLLDPAARVDHYVSRDRTTLKYFLRRCYHEGTSKAVVAAFVGPQASLSAEKSYTTSVLPRAVRRGVAARNLTGAARAATVIAGLAVTAAGYARGRAAHVRRGRVTT